MRELSQSVRPVERTTHDRGGGDEERADVAVLELAPSPGAVARGDDAEGVERTRVAEGLDGGARPLEEQEPDTGRVSRYSGCGLAAERPIPVFDEVHK